MRRHLLIGAALLALLSPAKAADSTVSAYTAASAIGGTELMYCSQGGADRKCTPVQLSTYIFGLISGDLTCVAGGACTLKSVGPGITGPIGSTTTTPVITIDAQGRVTGLTSATIAGGGAVSSVTGGIGVTCSPTTGSVVCSSPVTVRNNTATTDTITSADKGQTVTESNAASVAVAITTAGFISTDVFTVKNFGAGVATYTPSAGTIDGAATLACKQNQSADLYFDGTNYKTLANTCGLGTAATANTGTSGHTLPYLDQANAYSAAQTFGSVFGTVSTQSGTTYTLASTDCGTEIAFTNAAAVTVTIPAALTTGCNIAILQTTAAGQVTVTGTAVSAATLHSGHSYTKTAGQWSIIGINIYTTGVAILTGDGA